MSLLEVTNLGVTFPGRGPRDVVRAVDGVSFTVARGESVGLVGESGCGKSSVANAIMGLIAPSCGELRFEGADAGRLAGEGLRRFRECVQVVFQDSLGSLNPRLSVGAALAEVLAVHRRRASRRERATGVSELLKAVGLDDDHAQRYPHELSGGQRQRVGIARALAVEPSLLVADEPVSALDVSVQVQILNLLKDLRAQRGLACLLIAHDLAVVRYMCERVLVMYLGRIVEAGPTEQLLSRPRHPYTEALLSAVPEVEKGLRSRREGSKRIVLKGDVPRAGGRAPGCPFHPRCHRVMDVCRTVVPPEVEVGPGHRSVCHLAAGRLAPAADGGCGARQ